MLRQIAYLLFGLGIAVAIVGGAKLPMKQVEFLKRQSQLNEAIAALDASLADPKQQQLSTDQQAARRQNKTALQQTLQNLDGWPPNSAGERFSDAIPLFCGGVGLAIIGLVLWRTDIQQRRLAAAGKRNETNRSEDALPDSATDRSEGAVHADDKLGDGTAAEHIKSIESAILALSEQMDKATAEQLLPAIDAILDNQIMPFVEMRDRFVAAMGLAQAAPVLLTVAQGERLLNRAWSAAADGYKQESLNSITAACGAFSDALRQLDEGGEGVESK